METILLVEDSRFLRIATERALTKAGYQVICAGDGEEALAQTTARLPDLVVLDRLLPKLSGPMSCKNSKPIPSPPEFPYSFSPASRNEMRKSSSRMAPPRSLKKAVFSTIPASCSKPSKPP